MVRTFLTVMLGALVDDALQGMTVDSQPVGSVPTTEPVRGYASDGGIYGEPFGLVGNLDEMIN